MAMTLPLVHPSSPASANSPGADAGDRPRTPVSPQATSEQPQSQQVPASQAPNGQATNAANAANGAQMKRKPSRRANTAERRATHNAVERQRRETLNGRFLDLAALLPNLSQIRRPSKSSIVNSSIAHIHASRRHRILAARELRLLKLESDALRRELNEWRDRAGIPRIEEPIRGEGFSIVLSGELDVVSAVPGEEEDEDAQYNQYGEDDDEYIGPAPPMVQPHMEVDDHRMNMLKNAAAAANANPFAHSLPPPVVPTSATGPGHQGNGIHLSHVGLARPNAPPMIHPPPYDNGAAMAGLYDHGQQFSHYVQGGHSTPTSAVDPEKLAAWNMYNQQQHQQLLQAQRSLFTPPATSHGLPSNSSNAGGSPPAGGPQSAGAGNPSANPFSDATFFVNLQRQQMVQNNGNNNGHGYAGSDRDDASSVGSRGGGGAGAGGNERERSGSVLSAGSGSGYGGSPPHHPHHGGASPVGGFELGPGAAGAGQPNDQFAAARRWSVGVRDVVDLGVHGHGHHGLAISATGHGGGGGGFAMMM